MKGPLLFNPTRVDAAELASVSVGRSGVIDRLVRDIGADATRGTPRHWLVVGPRGIGKSHVAALVAERLSRDPGWTVVQLPEEHYQIANLAELLERVLARLEGGRSPLGSETDMQRVEDLALDRLATHRARGPVLVVLENFDDLLDRQLSNRDQQRLRQVLTLRPPFTLLATAPRLGESTTRHEAPFYDFFQVVPLPPLSRDQVKALVRARAAEDRATALLERWEEVADRIDAVYHLAGGNPRVALTLYQVLRTMPDAGLHPQLIKLLDELTPYYQSRLDDASPQMGRVLTELALAESQLTPSEVARRCRLPTNQVTANLKKLEDIQLARPGGRPDGRSRYWEVADRLLRIWLQMREDADGDHYLRSLTAFFDEWYRAPEQATARLAEATPEAPTPYGATATVMLAKDKKRARAKLHPEEREAVDLLLGEEGD